MKNIIVLALAILFIGCSEENKSSSNKVDITTKVATEKIVEKKIEAVEAKEAVVEEVKAVVAARTGQNIFAACSACHGADASKIALGKSQVVKGWSSEKVTNVLNGYKDGTYGGAMKGIMKGQVSALSDEDIKAVSEYISKL
ncbi:MAG: c-type cytochrome [Sulfurimonas sp.]|nr:c-type cytochrome [Sulfurimonas sp.]